MDLDDDRLALLLVRVSQLRSKVANCIARGNSGGEPRSPEQLNPNIDGDEDSESLLAICEAFDSLECQLGSLQALQQQQEYQRADAMAEIERSRKNLLKKLTEYDGEHLDLIKEASAFAALKVDYTGEQLLLPPYTASYNYNSKPPQNGHGGANAPNSNIIESKNVNSRTILSRSWTGLRYVLGSVAKTVFTIVAVVSAAKLAGFEARVVKKGSGIEFGGVLEKIGEEKRVDWGCPAGKVAVVEDGGVRCVVKERVEIPFDRVKGSPDVEYGCG